MKEKVLRGFAAASLGMFFFTLVLHLVGYFTYWESRWHLWLYVPLFLLVFCTLVYKLANRVPKGTFFRYCRKAFLLFCILLWIYLFVFWMLNIATTKDGGGYMDDQGFGYADEYFEYPISGEEYHTLRRHCYQMTTEPLVSLSLIPTLFFCTRYRALLNAPAKETVPRNKKRKRK